MNLLDNLTNLFKSGLAVLLIPFFFACNDPSDLGLELEQDVENIILKDTTLILPAYNLFIDSLRTDQYTSTIFGRNYDNIKGEVKAISNMSYRQKGGVYPGPDDDQEDTLLFESAEIRLRITDYRMMNNVIGEEIKVYQSSDTLFGGNVYLANRSLSKKGDPIADVTFSFNPDLDSVLTIPLSDEFGMYLFDILSKASQNSEFDDSLGRGQIRLDPLIFEPGDNNMALFSLGLQQSSTGIIVNMKSPNNPDTTYYHQFGFDGSSRFTGISRKRDTGELLSDLQNNYDTSFAATDRVYFDMIHGINPSISLTPLIELYQANENMIFNSALLSIEADPTGSDFIHPIQQMRFYFTEDDGTINATAVQNGRFNNYALLTENSYAGASPTLLTVNYDSAAMDYFGNLTLFSQILGGSSTEEENEYLTRNLVVLSPAGISVGQTSIPKSGIKLSLFYSVIKE